MRAPERVRRLFRARQEVRARTSLMGLTSQEFCCSSAESAEDVVQLLAGCSCGQTVEGTSPDLFGRCHHSSPCNPRQSASDTDPPDAKLSQFGNAELGIHHQHVK